MKELDKLRDLISRRPIGERIETAIRDTQLLNLLSKDGLVRPAEDFADRRIPRDALSQKDLEAIIEKLSGIINSGQASLNLAELIDQRVKKAKKIEFGLEYGAFLAGLHPEEDCYEKAFKYSILPIFVQVIGRVEEPGGVPFLFEMLKNEFNYPGGNLVQKTPGTTIEPVKEVIQKSWDLCEEELVRYQVDFEDLVIVGSYPLADAAMSSLTKIRQQFSLGENLEAAIDEAIGGYQNRQRKTYSIRREISRTPLES